MNVSTAPDLYGAQENHKVYGQKYDMICSLTWHDKQHVYDTIKQWILNGFINSALSFQITVPFNHLLVTYMCSLDHLAYTIACEGVDASQDHFGSDKQSQFFLAKHFIILSFFAYSTVSYCIIFLMGALHVHKWKI